VLLEGTPEGLSPEEILGAIANVDGVEAAHDLHVWSISSEVFALSVHVVVEGHPSLEAAQAVASQVRHELAHRFHISHSTIELECETCQGVGPDCEIELVVPSAPHSHHH
jgi:cobalt-zinc-cadmium efflux system protein